MTFSQNIICHKVPESKTCCQIHSFDATKMLCTKKLIPECPRETEGAFNTTCAKIGFKSGILIYYSTETSQYSNFITILQKTNIMQFSTF